MGLCELVYWLVNSMANCIYVGCGIIMWHADYIYTPIYIIISPNYIYVPKQYIYAVSTCHRYCNYTYSLNYVLLCASHHRTVALCCAVNSDSGTAQL